MRPSFVALWLYVALVGQAQASEAQAWMERFFEAEKTQSFSGVFVYERSGVFSTHQLWQLKDDQGVMHERVLQLDGALQEVLFRDGQVQCVSQGAVGNVFGAGWHARVADVARIAQWYDLSIGGSSRVAGRDGPVVMLQPKDQHRYGFELTLDQATGMPLKSLLLDGKGKPLERFQFTSFDAATPLASQLMPSSGCLPVTASSVTSKHVSPWQAGWLPEGFVQESVIERPGVDAGDKVSSILFGDGLAQFSVFLEPLHGAEAGDERRLLGPTAVVSKRVSTEDGDLMVTVVGEIPLGTAERVALSMRAAVNVN